MAEPPTLTPEPSGPRERITSRRYRITPFRYRQPHQNPLLALGRSTLARFRTHFRTVLRSAARRFTPPHM